MISEVHTHEDPILTREDKLETLVAYITCIHWRGGTTDNQ